MGNKTRTAQALEYLRQGKTPTGAAEAAGVSVAAVSRHREAREIAALRAQLPEDLRPLPHTPCNRAMWAARRLVASGMTLAEVAPMVRLTTRTLYRDPVIARYVEARGVRTPPGVYALPDWQKGGFVFVNREGRYVTL